MKELAELKADIIVALNYMEHDRHCEIDQCDVCTCGMVNARANLKSLYNEVLHKMPDLGQILNSIHKHKNDLFQEPDSDPQVVEKEYKKLAYVVNRCLSYFPDTIFYAQEMNMRSTLDGKPQYAFYLHGVKKGNRFARGMKADNPEHLEIVKEYYNFSDKKARKALQILSPEDIVYIHARLNRGGVSKKK